MSRKLFALDLSTSVGFALLEDGPPSFGTLRLHAAAPGDHGRRFAQLHHWLYGQLDRLQFDAVAYEKPILPRKSGDLATTMDTLTLLWGLTAIVQLFAGDNDLPCVGVSVQAVKKRVTGKGTATKDEMVTSALGQWGWRVANDHEADAGGVGLVAYEILWPEQVAA
jgi:Holliday junction resolvasome RuvABC endonuclease subunit